MQISENNLLEVRKLHEKGLHLQAYNLANSICPLLKWEGTDAILLASHLVFQLGAEKTSEQWVKRAWRKDKKHPRALFYRAADLSQAKGPIPALTFINKYGSDFQGDKKLTAWWYSLHVQVYAQLRDFKTAELWHGKAVQTDPQENWVWVSKSHLLELQDRYEESLETARKAYSINQTQRVTISQLAHILTLLEKYDEALDILDKASNDQENFWITKQLADLQTELGQHHLAYASYQRLLELSPLRDAELEKWLYAGLSDAAYLNGDVEKTIEFAEKTTSPFHQKIKEKLEKLSGDEKRVHLKLGFVRQHHLTCAPATLSNIARFWQKKAEHLELADEMCYEGTPAYKERIWATQNGWETREFTVNWANTVELINRGVPFTLATIAPGNGHLQAIVGYDERRKTMLVRDPYYQRFDEFSAEELLENQKSSGPRGLALVPVEKAELLQGLDLEESRQYDFLFEIDSSLEKHDRETALRALEEMKQEFPDHRLTLSAQWALASYDSNTPNLLKAVVGLLQMFPDDVNLKLSYLSISQEFTSRGERLQKLEEFSKAEKTDPLLWQMFGYELSAEAKSHKRALHWLYKSLRKIRNQGTTIRLIADILWSKRLFEDSLKLYWFSSCLNDKDEQFSYSYFQAARFLKKEDEAIELLYDRFARFGHQSNLPVRSLFHALRELGRTLEGFEVLEKAISKRPDDGELKLFIADAKARFGQRKEAEDLLKEAEKQSSRAIWLKTAAMISELQGNLANSLEYWREVAKIEPASPDVHEAIAFLLSALEGKASAQIYLRKVSREFPFNRNLQKLRLGYLNENTTEAIAVLRDLVRKNPQDAWGLRELANWLCRVKKYEKALEAAHQAVEINPTDSLSYSVLGSVLAQTGKKDEAVQAFKKSLSFSIDTVNSINDWLKLCRTSQEKLEVLRYVSKELSKQISFGEGLVAYREQAKRLIENETLLEELKRLRIENKNVWFYSSAVVQQLVDMHKLDEALQLAKENTERFPLIFQVWHDLSQIYKLRGENEAEINSLKQAISLNTYWSYGYQQLCEALQRVGNYNEAELILREALARTPLDHYLHGYLAEILWKLDKKEEGLNYARRAVLIQTDYDWAWHVIKNWSEELKQPELAIELGREMTLQKPKDVYSWLRYAQLLDNESFSQTQLDAVEEALKLDPQNELGLAMKANCLSDARRFDEAVAICKTTTSDGFQPDRLRFVQSGIEANRGNFAEAIKILEDLASSSPDYFPAWERLASIYRQSEENKDDYIRVTREMSRLFPQDALVFGYLGEAYLNSNRREEAKRAFNQAFIISPDYGFAGFSLFDLYFEDGEKDDCSRILNLLDGFVKEENTLIRKIAFSASEGDLETTERLWKELCLAEKAQRPQFDYVFEQFKKAKIGEKEFVWQTLHDVCLNPDANPLVGHYLIDREWKKKGEKTCLELLDKFESNEKVSTEGVKKFLALLLEERPSSLSGFIKKNSERLKRNDSVWASTGYCLNALNEYKEAKNWFEDWENREAQSWMLWNYSIVLRRLKENQKAAEINRRALEVIPDDTINLHLMMIDLDEIHEGNYEKGYEALAQINPQNMDEWDSFFYFLLNENIKIYQLTRDGSKSGAQDLSENMIISCLDNPYLWNDNIMSRYFGKSSKSVLALCESGLFKLRMRLKILFAKPLFR